MGELSPENDNFVVAGEHFSEKDSFMDAGDHYPEKGKKFRGRWRALS